MTNINVTKESGSTVKIEGEIPFEKLEKHREASVKKLGADVEVDGFRKGHVPENILKQHVGESAILGEMAERALAEEYPEIVKEHELDVVGHPEVTLTKLAEGNPMGFTATVAVMPEVTLPDYKKIASEQKKESGEVTDQDVEDAILNMQRQKIAYERLQKKSQKPAEPQEGETKSDEDVVDLPTPESTEADKTDQQEESPITTDEEFNQLEVPELTDEYVKTLGDFSSVDDFKQKMRQHLESEKTQEASQKHRAAITDKIIEESTIEIPQVMIDSEINQMFAQMEQELKQANLSMEDYLNYVNKTKEDLTKEWKPAAEKRAKLQLVLNEIANKEGIEADKATVDQEVDRLLEQYKDADRNRVEVYVATTLRNEQVMQMLEKESA